jgi:hypothetical protein
MMCDCIERVNTKLAEHNTIINSTFWVSAGPISPFVETRKLDTSKRGKPKAVFATFCPFCGEEYSNTEEAR